MRISSLASHTLSILIGRLALPFGAFLILIAIGRLSDELLGEYALVTTYYFVLQTLPLLGLTPFYMRELARRPGDAGRYFVTFAAMTSLVGVLINLALNAAVDVTHYSDSVNLAIRIVGITILPGILAFLSEITLISLDKGRVIAKIALAENLLRVIGSIVAVYIYRDVVSIVWVLFATRCMSLTLYLIALRLQGVTWTDSRMDFVLFRRATRAAPVFLLNTGLALILARLDFILLSFFETVETIGYYAIGYRIFEIAGIAVSAILAAIFPALSRKFHYEKFQFVTLLRLFLPVLVLLLSSIALVGYQLASTYVAILFPNQYPQPVAISQLFMLLLVAHGIGQTFSQSLNAIDRQGPDTFAMGAAVLVYTAMLLTFIPVYGMFGAFTAAAIAIVFQAALRFALLRKALRLPVFSNGEVAGSVVALTVLTGIMTLAAPIGILANFVQAAVAFVVAAFILKAAGLLKPLRAIAFGFARDARKHDDVTSVNALLRYIAHDYLRFERWWRRKLGNESAVRNFGFVAVALVRLSRYLMLRGWHRLGRLVWQVNTMISKADIRPETRIGSGLVLDAPVALGISGVVGRSATLFAHSALGRHGLRDIGSGPGLPAVGNHVTLLPRAYVLGPMSLADWWIVGAHAAVLRRRQIAYAADD